LKAHLFLPLSFRCLLCVFALSFLFFSLSFLPTLESVLLLVLGTIFAWVNALCWVNALFCLGQRTCLSSQSTGGPYIILGFLFFDFFCLGLGWGQDDPTGLGKQLATLRMSHHHREVPSANPTECANVGSEIARFYEQSKSSSADTTTPFEIAAFYGAKKPESQSVAEFYDKANTPK
jgi:hypothetical protein